MYYNKLLLPFKWVLSLFSKYKSLNLGININNLVIEAIHYSQQDWIFFETSWVFEEFPILTNTLKGTTVHESYSNWKKQCKDCIATMKELEEENNRLLIEVYGLQ
ncbi:type II restriction enzyme, methylase subunit [Candidatus Scalindua japonica]|uniref:Type II restriction enzyme, methylase subunit n=1 Tax=Candidatus Scalindua japonica TaxID=1284222 RepID=A0A286TVI5_9BACT|nr:hypothetical protein [Candidatus Scalindua japonica]GAX59864.1 type II restriction enzyme, methylase subunit [Candidatus Scalindua japonica]